MKEVTQIILITLEDDGSTLNPILLRPPMANEKPAKSRQPVTGTSKANINKTKAKLRGAAKGCNTITAVFASMNAATTTATAVSATAAAIIDTDADPGSLSPADTSTLAVLADVSEVEYDPALFEEDSDDDNGDAVCSNVFIPEDISNLTGSQHRYIKQAIEILKEDLDRPRSAEANIFATNRALAVHAYFCALLRKEPKIAASARIVHTIFPSASQYYTARALRSWALYYLQTGELPFLAQGQHVKVSSLVFEEDVREQCRRFMRSLKPNERKAEIFANWVGKCLIPRLGSGFTTKTSISVETARLWLHAIGFGYNKHSQDVYVDGHDRPDVKSFRDTVYIPALMSLFPQCRTFQGECMGESIAPPATARETVLFFHDECCFHANDGSGKQRDGTFTYVN